MNKNTKENGGEPSARLAGSVSMIDQINNLSLSSLDNWGVVMHCDHLFNQIHATNIAHSPSKRRPDNRFAKIGFVTELMIDEVHSEVSADGFMMRLRNRGENYE